MPGYPEGCVLLTAASMLQEELNLSLVNPLSHGCSFRVSGIVGFSWVLFGLTLK